LVKDIKLTEVVQWRAKKLVQGIGHVRYDDRLKYLGLTWLEKRTVRSDLTETYKIMNSKCHINRDLFLKIDDDGLSGHNNKFFKRRFKPDVRKFVFSHTVSNNILELTPTTLRKL